MKAGVRLAVKRVLRRNEVPTEHPENVVEVILEQAEALYRDWPNAAWRKGWVTSVLCRP
ncbi:MAG: DUF3387 domain-containing protein [Gemmatimonadetes bacterium]|nr:DUF3387 domain-containing protein [Gemmatimonadota bacterium]